MKTIFVTVGSTKFEKLINTILQDKFLDLMRKHSFEKLVLQVGNGKHDSDDLFDFDARPISLFTKNQIQIVAYRYKNSIREDMSSADLVISHAGSGSVVESLEANKKLIVVVNEDLMDNHQMELAEKMSEENYLIFSNCTNLCEKFELINDEGFALAKYKPADPKLFGNYLKKLYA